MITLWTIVIIQKWLAAQKASLGYIQSSVTSRVRKGILTLYSAQGRPPGVLHPAQGFPA